MTRRNGRAGFDVVPVLVCFALAAVGAERARGAEGALGAPAPRHVVMLSIDGLMPSAYTRADELGLAVPNLRRLAAGGAFARGVVGVLPTVTYPSHTTLITGVPPSVHGIVANTVFDPLGRSNEAWRWYAREIRSTTLVDAARAARRTVGAVSWPVSVGLGADYLVPEFWRTGSDHGSDLELLRALSTPGLLDAAEAARGAALGYPPSDAERMDVALTILRTWRPGLLLVHLAEHDSAAHDFGPGSPEAHSALERSDVEVGRLLAAIEELGLTDRTLVAIVSDHGFLRVERTIQPNALLVEHGLVELDANGKVVSWKAWFHSHGGSAALYLADPRDETTGRRVRELIAARAAEPDSGIAEILTGERMQALGGDGAAELFLDAADGFAVGKSVRGGWFGTPGDIGYHGFAPDRPALHASLILNSPDLSARGDLGVVPMTRIAATLAQYLGLHLAPEAEPALPVF